MTNWLISLFDMRLLLVLLVLPLYAAEEMAAIPAGTFLMGRTKVTNDDKTGMRPQILLDDRPVHKVTISAFRMDLHEVTNREYEVFVKATKHRAPYHWKAGILPDLPVYNVSWDDAKAYCEFAGKRLPTEAEWEYAARGGKESLEFPNGNTLDAKQAHFNVNTGPGPVAKHTPNGYGLFDMAGSVSEWTADWFDHDTYTHGDVTDPKGPPTGEYKVIRGGAWSDAAKRATVYFRNWVRPNQTTPNIGFRCVASGSTIH